MSLALEFASATDTGRQRRDNQDRLIVRPELALAMVADGLGGLPHGAEAAQHAIDFLGGLTLDTMPTDLESWHATLERLNTAVFELGLTLSPLSGIGTTGTILCASGAQSTIAHVGDSAALRLRAGRLEQLTVEHTVAAEIRSRRARGSHEPVPRGAEHILSSCLGLPYLPQVDIKTTELLAGDRLLLCSDGLTKVVAPASIAAILEHATTPAAAVAELIAAANAAGGPDNSTAIAAWAAPS